MGPTAHFVVGQAIALLALGLFYLTGGGKSDFARHSLTLTAVTAVLVAFLLMPLYERDYKARWITGAIQKNKPPMTATRAAMLLICGAGLAQYGNILMMLLNPILPSDSYAQEMGLLMDGKSFLILVLLLGILAPLGEEMSFRLLLYLRLRDYVGLLPALLVSSLTFGIYHGNLVQAVYAGILGCFFALGLELTGSPLACVLLHMGANIWSLVLTCFPYQLLVPPMDRLFVAFSCLMIVTIYRTGRDLWIPYARNGKRRWA